MEFIKVLKNKDRRAKELKKRQIAEVKQNLEISAYTSSLQDYINMFDYLFLGGVKKIYITTPKEYVNYFIQSSYKLGDLKKYKVDQVSEYKFQISEVDFDL